MKALGGHDTAFSMDLDVMQKTFTTNVVGPAYVAQAFVGLVEKSEKKTIVNISSTVGSIASDFGGSAASYAISKTALNMLVRPFVRPRCAHAYTSFSCRRTSRQRRCRRLP